jgi:hypothetical protein
MLGGNHWMESVVLDFVVKFFFVFGLIGMLVGLGLVFFSDRMQRLFGTTNHSVSLRQPTKWLEIPRELGGSVQRYRLGFGAVFIVAGLFGLLARPDLARLKSVFRFNDVAAIGADALGWLLLIGNALAVAVGLMLILSPRALARMENIANRWISTRQLSQPMHEQHFTLDQLVMGSPRASGAMISVGALYIVLQAGLVLFRLRPGI